MVGEECEEILEQMEYFGGNVRFNYFSSSLGASTSATVVGPFEHYDARLESSMWIC